MRTIDQDPVKFQPSSARTIGLAVLLIVTVLLAYVPALRGGFIWDDDTHLTANPCIVGPLGLHEIWTTASANYFPLVLTNFWVLHAFWGLNPLCFHLVNVLQQAACALALWRLLLALDVRGAWLGAALWAVHPVQVESVAWISELKNTQSGLFYVLALLFFVRWATGGGAMAEKKNHGVYVLALLCAVCAMLSKPSTVMLPIALALCWWWKSRVLRWRDAVWLAPFFALSAIVSAWTIWEQKFHSGALGPEWAQTWPERVIIAGKATWFYLGKLLWPHPLIFIYPRWSLGATHAWSYVPPLAVGVCLWLLWPGRHGRVRPILFTFGYFLALLFPVLGFFNVYYFRYSFVADHFQYLASMGPAALAGAGLSIVAERSWPHARLVSGLLALGVIGGLGMLTWRQSRFYYDEPTLYRNILAQNPTCWLAHNNFGLILAGSPQQLPEAIEHYEASLKFNPGNAEAHYNLANALSTLAGRESEAIGHYESALRLLPGYSGAHNNLGNLLARLPGRMTDAIGHFEAALRIKPDYAGAHTNLGNVLATLPGRLPDAVTHLEAAVRSSPENAAAQNNLANVLVRMPSRLPEAITHYEAALRRDPDNASIHTNLASAFLDDPKQLAQAISHYEVALRLQPSNPAAHYNLAVAVSNSPARIADAITLYEEATFLLPRY